jgi:hypothetical protein
MADAVDVEAIQAEVDAEANQTPVKEKKAPQKPAPAPVKAVRPDIDEKLTPAQRKRIKQKRNRERKRQGKTESPGPPRTYRRDAGPTAAEAAIEDFERGIDRFATAGDYQGEHSAPDRESGSPLHNVVGVYPDDVYGPNGLRYYGTGAESNLDRQAYNIIQRFHKRPDAKVTVYRAVSDKLSASKRLETIEGQMASIMRRGKIPSGVEWGGTSSQLYNALYEEREFLRTQEPAAEPDINPGDWVSTVRGYVKEHGEAALGGRYVILKKRVAAKDLFTAGDSWLEWGYSPDSGIDRFATAPPEFDTPEWRGMASSMSPHVRTPGGSPRVYYIGTTHSFTAFDMDRMNPENDLGRGAYASSSIEDVRANYAGEGPDLTNRIEQRFDQLAEDVLDDPEAFGFAEGHEPSDAEIRGIARRELAGITPHVKRVYMWLQNPAVIGGPGETHLEMDFNEDTEEESGSLVDFYHALVSRAGRYDGVEIDDVREVLFEEESWKLAHLIPALKERGLSYAQDYDTGELVSSEIIRGALEDIGFDGVVDNTVYSKFGAARQFGRPMEGLSPDTQHAVAFRSDQVKSIWNKRPTASPDIRFATAPTIEVDGQERHRLNSEGKPIATTDEALRNFWRWFGESKVVDEQGRPLVVYHGTTWGFTEFQVSQGGELGRGIYFSDDPDTANMMGERGGTLGSRVMSVYLSISNPLVIENREIARSQSRSTLQRKGYDGIIYSDAVGRKQYVAFEPTQIKSATGNRGTFSPMDPDIRRAAAYHGSPHSFDRFDTSKIGTGEGRQAFGYGVYLAEQQDIAAAYKKALARKGTPVWFKSRLLRSPLEVTPSSDAELAAWNAMHKSAKVYYTGSDNHKRFAIKLVEHMRPWALSQEAIRIITNFRGKPPYKIEPEGFGYTVDLAPNDDEYLLWDKLLEDQSDLVSKGLAKTDWYEYAEEQLYNQIDNPTGADLVRWLERDMSPREAAQRLRGAGVRGTKYLDGTSRRKGEGTYNYVVFDAQDIAIVDRWATAPVSELGFYSNTEDAFERMVAKSGAKKIQRDLVVPKLLAAGGTKEEVAWMGLGDWASAYPEPRIPVDELRKFIRENVVVVTEKVLGEDSGSTAGMPKHASYQLPGGENYRELLLTLPVRPIGEPFPSFEEYKRTWLSEEAAKEEEWARNAYERHRADDEKMSRRRGANASFASVHYSDTPNVLVHIRFNERVGPNGERVLFLEEVQSDWHQAGAKDGYAGDFSSLNAQVREAAKRQGGDMEAVEWAIAQLVNEPLAEKNPDAERAWAILNSETDRTPTYDLDLNGYHDLRGKGVPNAPFKEVWEKLAMRRMVRWAADNGFDQIAWTTGVQQVERYETQLRQTVDSIEYEAGDDGWILEATKGGATVLDKDGLSDKDLVELVGKDIGARILNGEGVSLADERPLRPDMMRLEGDDLTIGGEGMKAAYDRRLVGIANKIGNPFGAEVGKVKLDAVDTPVHTLPITESMRSSTMAGQVMWATAPEEGDIADIAQEGEESMRSIQFDRLSRFDQARRAFQDFFLPVRKLQKALEDEAGAEMPDEMNVSRAQRNYYGRLAEVLRVTREKVEAELVGILGEDITLEEAHDYALAKHAPEANAYIYKQGLEAQQAYEELEAWKEAKRKWEAYNRDVADGVAVRRERPAKPGKKPAGPDPNWMRKKKGGGQEAILWHPEANPASSVRSSVAMKLVNEVESGPLADRYKRLSAFLRRQSRKRIKILRESGEMSPALEEAIAKTGFKHYVPLVHEMKRRGKPKLGMAKGFQSTGPGIKRRGGRKSAPDNVVMNTVRAVEDALFKAEKKRVVNTMRKLIEAFPDKNFWNIYDVPVKVKMDQDGIMREHWEMREDWREDAIQFYDGEGKGRTAKVIVFNDKAQALSRAFKGGNVEESGAIMKAMRAYVRYQSAINTSLNIEFALFTNFVKDLQTAGLVLAEAQGWDAVKVISKRTPSAIRGIYRSQRGKESDWTPWWDRLREAGGKTGYFHARGIEEIQADMEKAIRKALAKPEGLRKGIDYAASVLEFINEANEAVENGVRLSAFKYGIEVLGMSDTKAAELAKTLTIDFNTRGEQRWLSGMYMFSNAGLQGTARMMASGVTTKRGRKISASIMLLFAMLDQLNYWLSGDDDDGRNRWDARPEHEKDRYLQIYTGVGESGFFSLPMPYGYSFFATSGRTLSAMARTAAGRGETDVLQGFANTASSAMSSFSPVGDAHDFSYQSALRLLSPTITDPLVELAVNQDWKGSKIYAGDNDFDRTPGPRSEAGRDYTADVWKQTARLMNSLTGGDRFSSGLVDVHPETLKYLVGTGLGGTMRVFNNALDAGTLAADGDLSAAAARAPFVRHLFKEESARKGYYDFYANSQEVLVLADLHESYSGSKDPDDKAKGAELYKDEKAVIDLARKLKVLEKRRKRMQDRIKTTDDDDKRATLEAALYAELRAFNRDFQQAKKQ